MTVFRFERHEFCKLHGGRLQFVIDDQLFKSFLRSKRICHFDDLVVCFGPCRRWQRAAQAKRTPRRELQFLRREVELHFYESELNP